MSLRRLPVTVTVATSAIVVALLTATVVEARPAAADEATPIPFELVALVAEPAGINLQEGHTVRVADESDRADLRTLLTMGTGAAFADSVIDRIDERFASALPEGTTLLVGVVHTGCFPAESVLVTATAAGEVTMTGTPGAQEGTVECVVALSSVAVVAVDSRSVPPGAADGATLVAFGPVAAVELPPQRKDQRRFVFALTGCRETTAELVVTPALIDATLETAPGESVWDCDEAEQFLAVFDVPADTVRPNAVLAGG